MRGDGRHRRPARGGPRRRRRPRSATLRHGDRRHPRAAQAEQIVATAGRTPWAPRLRSSTTPAASTSSPPRRSRPRGGGRCGGSTSAARSRCREAADGRAMRAAGRGMIVNVTVSPHHGMPAMAHTGAARAAVESLTASSPAGGARTACRSPRRDRAVRDRIAAQVPRGLWRSAARDGPAAAPRDDARSSAGSSRCSPRPLGRRSPAPWSPSTAALDNWSGTWPPAGARRRRRRVPTEARSVANAPSSRPAAPAGHTARLT